MYVSERECVCSVQDHKNVALWRAVKGAVNLEEEGAGSRPTHTNTRLLGGGRETDRNRRLLTNTHTQRYLPLSCCWVCVLRCVHIPLFLTDRCQPSAPRLSLHKAGCTISPDIRSPSAHKQQGGLVSVCVERERPMKDDRERSKHLSGFICALRDVQDTIHLHVVRVKRLVIHLERKQVEFC